MACRRPGVRAPSAPLRAVTNPSRSGRRTGARMPTVTTTLFRRAPAVVLCALAAHAVVYRSLWPAGGDHGYLTWYTPLVAVLSGLSLVALPLGLALGIAGRRRPRALRAVAAVFVRVAP